MQNYMYLTIPSSYSDYLQDKSHSLLPIAVRSQTVNSHEPYGRIMQSHST